MQQINIRQMRNLLGKLDQLVEQEQEIIIIRHKQAIARIAQGGRSTWFCPRCQR